MSSAVLGDKRAPVVIGAIVVVLMSAVASFGARLWREHQDQREVAEVAERYLTLMHSGHCAAAQQLTVFPASAKFCDQQGTISSGVLVRCDRISQQSGQYQADCSLGGSSGHGELRVLLVRRDERLQVVDETLPPGEGFGPP